MSPGPDFPGSRTVLVVDDVRAVRRMTARLLSEAGYRVFEAAGASEALEVLELAPGRVDVVLVDVVMPARSGTDLVRVIRQRWPDQRIVFMSAHPAEVLAREGVRDPALPFLPKPFSREELLAVLRRARAGAPRAATGTRSAAAPRTNPEREG
ncbi:MAG TPA: response regulator [Gemmatimonadales bacterium]|nr:response regulator [Gemmatimonadales bacterium]